MRWQPLPLPDKSKVTLLQKEVGVSSVVATLLVQRGMDTYDEVKDFFRPKWEDLHDPFLMQDMDHAVDRINRAVDTEEKIMVYGDYDVDGTTSVALLTSFLKKYSTSNNQFLNATVVVNTLRLYLSLNGGIVLGVPSTLVPMTYDLSSL